MTTQPQPIFFQDTNKFPKISVTLSNLFNGCFFVNNSKTLALTTRKPCCKSRQPGA